jgi:hypothetical protein
LEKNQIEKFFLENPFLADLDCILKHAGIAEHCVIEVVERLVRLNLPEGEVKPWVKVLGLLRKQNMRLLRKFTGETRPDLDWNFWRGWLNLANASSHACESAADHLGENEAEALEMLKVGDLYRSLRQKMLIEYWKLGKTSPQKEPSKAEKEGKV